ncbi:hypothetical protein Leryth_023543 [Lithospermum erythrorhizon]|nr:hypothetical protein Leryth_023543 [Lithospermum erythrorhizon]
MWILVLLTVILADHIGIPHEIAAFLLGLIGIPDGPPLDSSLVKQLETLVDGLLAPLMVSYCGTKVGLGHYYDLKYIGVLWILVGCRLVIKVVSLLLPALVVKVPPRNTVTLAFIVSSQGNVQICSHLFLLTVEVYNEQDFSVMVLSVLLIAAVTNTLAKSTYDYSFSYIGYNKRTIQHEGVDGELTLLQCICRLDDVFPTRKLLEVSMPDENSPLSVSVMHLGELVGRASPQLIDRKFSQKEILSSSIPHLQELLEFFVNFEQKNTGLVHVQFFSAISMKWNHQGKVISDNNNLRAVNINVLKMLPCSVGILVDRQKVHHSPHTTSSSCNIGVIFIGGLDDIEALYYGKRMPTSPKVQLTVVQFLAETNAFANEWDEILDTEALRELKVAGKDNIVYRKEVLKHGAETALIIHELQESCDIVLVGMRHKENLPQLYGLTEWNEFPELGPLGDIMPISEIEKPH